MIDHPAFNHFNFLEPHMDGVFRVDCLGVKARSRYMPPSWSDATERPAKNEMLFEWIDLLTPADETAWCRYRLSR
jgi:hypothetical protein